MTEKTEPDYDDWVERLERENPHAHERVMWMHNRITDLMKACQLREAANARLAGALEEIAAGCGHTRCHAYPWIRLARKALGY